MNWRANFNLQLLENDYVAISTTIVIGPNTRHVILTSISEQLLSASDSDDRYNPNQISHLSEGYHNPLQLPYVATDSKQVYLEPIWPLLKQYLVERWNPFPTAEEHNLVLVACPAPLTQRYTKQSVPIGNEPRGTIRPCKPPLRSLFRPNGRSRLNHSVSVRTVNVDAV